MAVVMEKMGCVARKRLTQLTKPFWRRRVFVLSAAAHLARRAALRFVSRS